MWEYILGGATLLGAILGIFTWLNGRSIKALINQESQATRELIRETRDYLGKILEAHGKILERMDSRLARIELRMVNEKE